MNKFKFKIASKLCLALVILCQIGIAQNCSNEALTAKYWQYRETFNKHFIMNDRKPEGCIRRARVFFRPSATSVSTQANVRINHW